MKIFICQVKKIKTSYLYTHDTQCFHANRFCSLQTVFNFVQFSLYILVVFWLTNESFHYCIANSNSNLRPVVSSFRHSTETKSRVRNLKKMGNFT